MSNENKACAVPLHELLQAVPANARLEIQEGEYSTRYIPVGRYCKEAADEIQILRAENAKLSTSLVECGLLAKKSTEELIAAKAENAELEADLMHASRVFEDDQKKIAALQVDIEKMTEANAELRRDANIRYNQGYKDGKEFYAALQADALRYRWLRANEGTDDGGILVVDAACDHCDYIGTGKLDAAIDAAMKEPAK